MVKQLQSALDELESAKLIIKLLQEETEKDSPHGVRTNEANAPEDTSAKVYSNGLENNKWTVITAKNCRKGFPPKNLTEVNNTYPLSTANRYKQLTNLQDTLAKDITSKIQEESSTPDIPNSDLQTKLQYQSRGRIQRIEKKNREDSQTYYIPTLLNGETEHRNMETVPSVVTRKISVTKKKVRQHNVTMIGDSFQKGIRENVEASITEKFGIYSVVKPGAELKHLLESAKSVTVNLTHKDVLFICGGSNDFNHDKDESVIDHIMEFIKTNNHTNIVLTNVPTRYDLSYYSQVNKGIRHYNEKLREITKEHKQLALIETDIDRKYHT